MDEGITLRERLGPELAGMLDGTHPVDWATAIPHALDLDADLALVILDVLRDLKRGSPTPPPGPNPTPPPGPGPNPPDGPAPTPDPVARRRGR